MYGFLLVHRNIDMQYGAFSAKHVVKLDCRVLCVNTFLLYYFKRKDTF